MDFDAVRRLISRHTHICNQRTKTRLLLPVALAVVRVFVGLRLEQVQFGLEALHVRRQLGDLTLLLFDGRLESGNFVAPLLMSRRLVVKPIVKSPHVACQQCSRWSEKVSPYRGMSITLTRSY